VRANGAKPKPLMKSALEQIARTFADALDSIKRLERIAVAHEQRLDDIERNP
jgi:hypothetical protein